jgi:hypothetical protein
VLTSATPLSNATAAGAPTPQDAARPSPLECRRWRGGTHWDRPQAPWRRATLKHNSCVRRSARALAATATPRLAPGLSACGAGHARRACGGWAPPAWPALHLSRRTCRARRTRRCSSCRGSRRAGGPRRAPSRGCGPPPQQRRRRRDSRAQGGAAGRTAGRRSSCLSRRAAGALATATAASAALAAARAARCRSCALARRCRRCGRGALQKRVTEGWSNYRTQSRHQSVYLCAQRWKHARALGGGDRARSGTAARRFGNRWGCEPSGGANCSLTMVRGNDKPKGSGVSCFFPPPCARTKLSSCVCGRHVHHVLVLGGPVIH